MWPAYPVNAQGYSGTAALFTVENVRIDVTADNALTARDQAFDQAQTKAFTVMAERMLPETELAQFTPPNTGVIATMVQDYELTKEKLSSVRYIGTYTFRFRENAVRRYFTKTNVPYTDVKSPPILMLPFYRSAETTILWSQDNPWLESWKRSGSGPTLVPVIVPIGDLDDVKAIGDDESYNYNPYDLRRMMERYGAKESVITIADQDGAMINVDIYRTDQMRPSFVRRIQVNAAGPASYAAAVQQVKTVLQSDWKNKTAVAPAAYDDQRLLSARAVFSTLKDWAAIQSALRRIAAIQSVDLQSLSQGQALLTIKFTGARKNLKLALAQHNIGMNISRYAPPQSQNTPIILYDLHLIRSADPYAARTRSFYTDSTPEQTTRRPSPSYTQRF